MDHFHYPFFLVENEISDVISRIFKVVNTLLWHSEIMPWMYSLLG